MLKLNKRACSVGLVAASIAALSVLSHSANAGLDLTVKPKASAKGDGTKTRPTKIESMARIQDKSPTDSFKCWQEGRLIFQRSGLEIKKQKLPGATTINANGKKVQVLDLKQGLCILDRAVK